MLDYLRERKRRCPEQILSVSYLAIWAASFIVFWFFTDGSDAMGYGIVFLYMVLPITIFVFSLLIGKNNYWGKWKWFAAPVFGIMYMLVEYGTFSAANMISYNKINLPQFTMVIVGMIISIAGLGIGIRISRFKINN